MKNILLIFGEKSTAIEIYETALMTGFLDQNLFFIGTSKTNYKNKTINENDLEEFIDKTSKESEIHNIYYILSMQKFKIRKKCLMIATSLNINPITIIHPNATIFNSALIGDGCYIAAGSVISVNATIKKHCIINFNVTIGHNTIIDEHVIINPGTNVSGNVCVEKNVLIGSNSIIMQNTCIKDYVEIDANTYIYSNVDSYKLCASRNTKIYKNYKQIIEEKNGRNN